MFDRFIRLARARKALQEERFEDAMQLAADPLIQSDRRAGDVRSRAREQLLARAQKKLQAGDARGARAELRQVERGGRCPLSASLEQAIDRAEANDQSAVAVARSAVAEARRLLGRGDAAGASALLLTIGTEHLLLERQQVAQLVAEHRRRAAEHLQAVPALLQGGDVEAAAARFQRGLALDRDAPAAAEVRPRLLSALAEVRVAAVGKRLAAGDLVGALAAHRAAVAELPALAAAAPFDAMAAKLAAGVKSALCACPTIDEAVALARAARAAEVVSPGPTFCLIECLGRAEALAPDSDCVLDAEVAAAATALGAKDLAAAAAARATRGMAHAAVLERAKAAAAAGDLEGGRALLAQLLAEQPMHEQARREIDLVDKGLADVQQRLGAARAAARVGRLREACTAALALAGPSRLGQEAQAFAAEVRARMTVVDRGLDEVRVALHGRAASSIEGVRHSLRRLEELGKVQVDHEELGRITAAVVAEIEALEVCERVVRAFEAGHAAAAGADMVALLSRRASWIAPDRLDARLCELGDRLCEIGDQALAAGCFVDLEVHAGVLREFAAVRPEFAARAERWSVAAQARCEAAERLVAEARRQLAARDLAEAERLAEQAEAQWAESAAVRALQDELRQLRAQTAVLARVDELASERDFQGAHRQLAELPPTPALLRTRIFDMKQNLARAQGLEGAFLLRIDEGGEHLVLRGESVSFGNIRQTRADLPILANLAGRHASVRRSMSFHGGMQDTVVAEEGEVRVGGRPVAQHRLVPGDRVALGSALSFAYHQPCSRSLSVGIVLHGGFQVAGTDRIVLMKDRGRDGRILIGPGPDVHIRVAKATAEVELFTTNDGQVRVLCEAGGTIDRVAFRGEHPVGAGQIVEAGGVGFLLLPWRPTA